MAEGASALTRYVKRALLVGASVLCAFAVSSALWNLAHRQTVRRVYRLELEGGQAATSEHLQRTAEVLAARGRALQREVRISRAGVRVVRPDRVEVILTCTGDPSEPLAWLTMQGRVEFRLLHPLPDALTKLGADSLPPDYEVKAYRERRYVLTRLNEMKTVEHRYVMRRDAALAVAGFDAVSVRTVGARSRVVLTCSLSAGDAQALATVTALNAGRDMAMLVDGEMFFPPQRIGGPVTGGTIQAEGFFQTRLLRRLALTLGAGSLPGRLVEEVPPSA